MYSTHTFYDPTQSLDPWSPLLVKSDDALLEHYLISNNPELITRKALNDLPKFPIPKAFSKNIILTKPNLKKINNSISDPILNTNAKILPPISIPQKRTDVFKENSSKINISLKASCKRNKRSFSKTSCFVLKPLQFPNPFSKLFKLNSKQ